MDKGTQPNTNPTEVKTLDHKYSVVTLFYWTSYLISIVEGL